MFPGVDRLEHGRSRELLPGINIFRTATEPRRLLWQTTAPTRPAASPDIQSIILTPRFVNGIVPDEHDTHPSSFHPLRALLWKPRPCATSTSKTYLHQERALPLARLAVHNELSPLAVRCTFQVRCTSGPYACRVCQSQPVRSLAQRAPNHRRSPRQAVSAPLG